MAKRGVFSLGRTDLDRNGYDKAKVAETPSMSQDDASRRIILDTALKSIGKAYAFASHFWGTLFAA
jgi:hypothetical protein